MDRLVREQFQPASIIARFKQIAPCTDNRDPDRQNPHQRFVDEAVQNSSSQALNSRQLTLGAQALEQRARL